MADNDFDCGTKSSVEYVVERNNVRQLLDRYIMVDGEVRVADYEQLKPGNTVHVRTMFDCKNEHLTCHTCSAGREPLNKKPFE